MNYIPKSDLVCINYNGQVAVSCIALVEDGEHSVLHKLIWTISTDVPDNWGPDWTTPNYIEEV